MPVDNDAGGIATYSIAGADFGYTLSVGRGARDIRAHDHTGDECAYGGGRRKGLADLIRETFGAKVTFYAMLALLISNSAIR